MMTKFGFAMKPTSLLRFLLDDQLRSLLIVDQVRELRAREIVTVEALPSTARSCP